MAKLGEVCKLNMGQSPDSSSYNDTGDGIPFFQGNADFGEVHPNIRVWCNAPTKIAHPGEILISVRAPIGAMNIADCECCIGRGLASISADEAICTTKYLWYGISSKIEELNAKGTGSTFKAINKKTLEETEIPIRDLMEQKRIAANLDRVTALISLRKQQLAKLDELVKARFVEMFGDFEFNPKEFAVYHLCELCDVGSSKRIYQEEQSISGIPFLKVADLNELIDTGKYSCSTFIPLERYEQLLHKELTPTENDILITSRGTLGKCYIVQSDDEFYFQDGMISWLSNFSPKVSSIYISYLFAQPYIQKQIESLQAGSTVAYLSIAMLKKINVILPPKKLQDDFATFVEHVDQQKQTVQQSLEKLELMKKALMQEYFG